MRADDQVFPQWTQNKDGMPVKHSGLTKRELFVMAAMQGLCAVRVYDNTGEISEAAIKIADATLAALEQSHDRG